MRSKREEVKLYLPTLIRYHPLRVWVMTCDWETGNTKKMKKEKEE